MAVEATTVGGPFFEDLRVGAVHRAPALTLTSGIVAAHQMIVGDRCPATLDHDLGRAVHDRTVLDFVRCAMLPLRAGARHTGRADDLDAVAPTTGGDPELGHLASGWHLAALRGAVPGPYAADLRPGRCWTVEDADVVTSAPELARLTLNVAAVHHDRRAGSDGRRLVYGGHTIGLAAQQVHRSLPAVACVIAWERCEHTGPVYEDDDLTSEIQVVDVTPLDGGGALAHMRSVVHAHRPDGAPAPVLDWRFVAVVA